ncbi:hypothetical protein WIW50_18705 [Flavobacteriaceae bacterium 3-367]
MIRPMPRIANTKIFTYTTLLCAAGILFSEIASAQTKLKATSLSKRSHAQGFYMEVRGGLSFFDDTKLHVDRLEQVFGKGARSDFDTKPGRLLEMAAGHSLGPWFRWEISGGHLRSALEDYRFLVGGRVVKPKVDGTIGGLYGLGNLYCDLYPSLIGIRTDQLAFVLGGGIGLMDTALEAQLDGARVIKDSDTVVAYQLTAGVSFRTDRTLTLSAMYRHLDAGTPSFKSEDSRLGEAQVAFGNHNIFLGIRFTY